MRAEFYRARPNASGAKSTEVEMTINAMIRQSHRWISMVFILSVVANFVVMAWGPPPAWITYAPLVPLLPLMLTGLAMFVQSYANAWTAKGKQA
jgi:peptidoglycan/LPS O-acetylase OafA/YrhL